MWCGCFGCCGGIATWQFAVRWWDAADTINYGCAGLAGKNAFFFGHENSTDVYVKSGIFDASQQRSQGLGHFDMWDVHFVKRFAPHHESGTRIKTLRTSLGVQHYFMVTTLPCQVGQNAQQVTANA